MSLAEGMLFSYLWRKKREDREARENDALTIERMTAQRDALKEVVKTLVPEDGVRKAYVIPLYHKLLRQEYAQRGIPLPSWLKG